MKMRNPAIAILILALGAGQSAFAATSTVARPCADAPAAPAGSESSAADKKAAAAAAKKAAKARLARCRLHPEVCRQSPDAGSPPRRAR